LQKRKRRVLESGGAVAGLATAAFLCSACMSPPSEAGARLADVYQQAAQMELALDSLEERLLGAQNNLQLWQEIARRHQSVSEIACQNLEEHVKGMARAVDRQQEKTRGLRRRIASATAVSGGVAASSAKLRN